MNSIVVRSRADEHRIPIAPLDVSAVRCRDCNEYLNKQEALLVEVADTPVLELSCGHIAEVEDYVWTDNVAVQREATRFLNVDTVKNSEWFHSTNITDWHEKVLDNNTLIHLGTEEAALSRAYYISRMSNSDMMMYCVKLKKNIQINDYIILDEDEWDFNYLINRHKVNRYLNMYESIGSISLLLHPSLFEVVETYYI